MNFKLWLENQNQMIAYHKTNIENVENIFQNGFSLEKARKYELGLGIYLTPSLYGMKFNQEPIIKCIINASNFLDVSNQNNNLNKFTPEEQKFLLELNWYVPPNTYNSDIIKKVKSIFSGLMTNRIIVCYNPKDIVPQSVVQQNEMPR